MARREGAYLDPFLDVRDVFVAVRQVLAHLLLVAVDHVGLGRLAAFDGHGPGAVLDAGSDMVGAGVGVGGGEVHVFGACWAVIGVEGVHARDFAGVGVHAPGGLA